MVRVERDTDKQSTLITAIAQDEQIYHALPYQNGLLNSKSECIKYRSLNGTLPPLKLSIHSILIC